MNMREIAAAKAGEGASPLGALQAVLDKANQDINKTNGKGTNAALTVPDKYGIPYATEDDPLYLSTSPRESILEHGKQTAASLRMQRDYYQQLADNFETLALAVLQNAQYDADLYDKSVAQYERVKNAVNLKE